MDAGKLDKRVLIKSVNKTADGFGGFTDSVSTLKTIWANVKEVSGNITTENGRRTQVVEIEVICRTKAIDSVNLNTHYLQIEGESDEYRIDNIIEQEYKYFDKIIASKTS